ncbi:MAG: hypothetical protein MI861_24160, partial [Pirellulales bacterium]|nr:hypothetical protein [Pirellulales bacterium]
LKIARYARRHRAASQAAVLGLLACLLIAGLSATWMRGLANNAQQLRDRNLATSSQFMARSIGQDIDRIWRVLEFEANAPELRSLVIDANERIQRRGDADLKQVINIDSQQALQQWLQTRLEELHTVPSLFVLSHDATQLARAPLPKKPQLGENFAFRDYYTGLGYDLAKGSRSILGEPLTGPMVRQSDVHMSVVYLSTLAGQQVLKVTFTVPIWDESHRRRIGVLGTSVSIGDIFNSQQRDENPPWLSELIRAAWLVDLRSDDLEDDWQRGLLLQHPLLEKQDLSTRLPRLSLSELQLNERSVKTADAIRMQSEPKLLEITDPIDGSRVHASAVPIVIDGRGDRPLELNWVVINAEQSSD